jgi:hypothetical protein
MALAALAATAQVSQVQCTPTGEHALPVTSAIARSTPGERGFAMIDALRENGEFAKLQAT